MPSITSYTYSITQDFPNHKVDPTSLSIEIEKSQISISLDYMNTETDSCIISFKAELPSGDKALLDEIVSAHQGQTTVSDDNIRQLSWSQFKLTYLPIQVSSVKYMDYGEYYEIWVSCSGVKFFCYIYKLVSPQDKTDFEQNYKSQANAQIRHVDEFGVEVVTQGLDTTLGFYPKKKSYKIPVQASGITFFDIEVTTEKRLCGGEYWIKCEDSSKVHDDDYVEFSIIDKNDTLGMFSMFGLNKENGDVLELSKFILTDFIKKGCSDQGFHSILYEGIKGTNTVFAGLFMRIAVESFGTEPYSMISRIYYYE